jgi:hypothetical protein
MEMDEAKSVASAALREHARRQSDGTGSATAEPRAPTTSASEEQRDEQTKVGSKNPMKSDSNQNKTLPNFARIKFNMPQTYPQEIIALD